MKNILSELYHGSYSGVDTPYKKNADYTKAIARASVLEDHLRETLPEELLPQFEEYVSANSETLMAYGEKDFTAGFRLGVQMLLAALPLDAAIEENNHSEK